MSTLTQANKQWTTRPAEERYTSLTAMSAHFHALRAGDRAELLAVAAELGLVGHPDFIV